MKFLKIFLVLVFFTLGAQAEPWFTGPLLTPSATTTAPQKIKLQPYFENTIKIARYDSHWHIHSRPNFYTGMLRVKTKVGLSNRIDFQITPRVLLEKTQGRQAVNVGDLPIGFNVLVLKNEERGLFLKLLLRTNLPIGHYQKANANKERTDLTGSGGFFPGGGFSFASLWHLEGHHFVELRFSSEYRFGTPISVRGVNAYGGTKNTKGTVYPGDRFFIKTAVQYSFTQNVAFACDAIYSHLGGDSFSGREGNLKAKASADLFSLAPALEYNWSKDLGIIGGVWFSIAGKNANVFLNPMISLVSTF